MTILSIDQARPLNKSEATENTAWLDGRQGIVDLNWRAGLLEQIRSYVGSTYISRSGKGADVGGLLYGIRQDESVQVMTWRPIKRGRDATAYFYLNSREEQFLRKSVENAKSDTSLKSMELLGWFRSKTKGEPDLDEHDVKFHEKFFERSSQFAMIIRPSHQRPADASVYIRNRENLFELGSPTIKLSLKAGPVATENMPAGLDSIPGVSIEETATEAPCRWSWLNSAALLIAACIATAGLVWLLQWNAGRHKVDSPSAGLGLEISITGTELKAKWDASSSLIQSADSAQLFLGDNRIQLSHSELAQGYLTLPMKSDGLTDTGISLKVGDREEFAQVVAIAR